MTYSKKNSNFAVKFKNMKTRGTILTLIWLDKGEMDPLRYETFASPSALYSKYSSEEIGAAQGTLHNALGKLDDSNTPILFIPPKNKNLRIVKSALYVKETPSKTGPKNRNGIGREG